MVKLLQNLIPVEVLQVLQSRLGGGKGAERLVHHVDHPLRVTEKLLEGSAFQRPETALHHLPDSLFVQHLHGVRQGGPSLRHVFKPDLGRRRLHSGKRRLSRMEIVLLRRLSGPAGAVSEGLSLQRFAHPQNHNPLGKHG